MRRSTDRLFVRETTPQEQQALEIIADRPGITVGELRDALGVGRARIWQIVARLEWTWVRRDGDPPRQLRKSSPRRPIPTEFELFVCRACGAWNVAPDEIAHNSARCEGRTDPVSITPVTARLK